MLVKKGWLLGDFVNQDYLKEHFAEKTVDFVSDGVMSSIVLIGGTPRNGQLSSNDRFYLENAFDLFQATSIPVARNFHVSVANIDPVYGGVDALDAQQSVPADVWIICFLPNQNVQNLSSRFVALGHTNHLYSPLDKGLGEWHQAASRNKVKAIVTMGMGSEVNHLDFLGLGSPYIVCGLLGENGKYGALLVHRDYLRYLPREGLSQKQNLTLDT